MQQSSYIMLINHPYLSTSSKVDEYIRLKVRIPDVDAYDLSSTTYTFKIYSHLFARYVNTYKSLFDNLALFNSVLMKLLLFLNFVAESNIERTVPKTNSEKIKMMMVTRNSRGSEIDV